MDVFMRESDAFSWYMERDPVLRSTVVAVAWVEQSPDWDLLSAKVDQATRLVPLFRKRVTEPPGRLATPRWTVDDQFDLRWHLRRIDAPAPHTPQTVVDFARNEAMTAFDHARPLWKFTLVEHLEGDRAALVMKIHHSLTDGLGGIEMALLLFDTGTGASTPTVLAEAPAPEQVDTPEIVRESIARGWSRVTGFLNDQARAALPVAVRTARHPVTSLGRAVETSRSVWRTVAPVSETLSPVMRGRGLGRHLEMVEFALADMRRAAGTAGGTVNDGFVASLTGALRRYHERKSQPVETLRVTLPISIRTQDDPLGGNRITLIRVVVRVSEADPARRIPEIHDLCCTARHERSLAYTNAIAGTLNLLPAGVLRSILKHVDFVASDVPGFPFPVYLAGAMLERYVAFGPTIGAAVNETLLSYNGRCCVGVTLDTAAVDDRDLFVESLRGGFEEVLALGGDHEPVLLPLRSRTVASG
jgi:diacylglycerol O-acyltransferase / wax synthase